MNFDLPERVKSFVEQIREFVDQELIPLEPLLLQAGFRSLLPELETKRQWVKAQGLWAPNHPIEYGGMGLDLMEHALVSEALGRTPLGHYVFGCHAPDAGNVELLHRHGSSEMKSLYLEPLVAGKIRSCFGMTEKNTPGSNPVMLATTATREGDEYVINGEKWFTTSADGAQFCIVMAVTDPEASKHLRASMIIVPTDTPGFRLVRNIPVMGHAGEDHMSHGEIQFENCRVPVSNRLGPEGQGFLLAQERLGPGRIHHCMRWIGICNRAFELLCHRAGHREIAPGTALGTQGVIQAWIADSAAEIQAARLMVLHAAWQIETIGAKAARNEISMIKYFVAKTLQNVVDRSLQAHGALGMTDDTILAFFYREERAARIYDGPDEVHKVSVAKRFLKPQK